ncbi:MAG: sigma 54-interacting transcriptional regulator [Candidatus Eisenbacteria bacterium]|nr:sigma 54-interacting transcriptional regulator [Candidatus Eisenbacteria bacterium]
MARVLLAWIGLTDLKAAEGGGAGPIAEALAARKFDQVVLLNNFPKEQINPYVRWVAKQTDAEVVVQQHVLSSPTDHADIYRAVSSTVAWTLEKHGAKTRLTFHLSPGTPAMAAIWIIVAKTRFGAELIESSREKGVATVNVPFELAAEFIPAAVQQTSADLAKLADGVRPEEPKFGDILHRSEVMKRLVRRARQAAPFSESVFIEGESGTGKQLLAEAIHGESPRKGKPFVEVNCGAIPKELFESQFFGHTRGAFTGADRDHKGFFEQADGGSLFLDEVGELAVEHQAKLLRALQQRRVRPIGGRADVPVDVRVIAATNRNLLQEVREGRFREDLYFRLAVLVLKTPPLREREGDVSFLLDRLLDKLNAEMASRPGAVQKKVSVGARNLLLRYDWPGNVRELESTLRRAFIWSRGAVIDEGEARDALLAAPRSLTPEVLGRPLGGGFNLSDLMADVARHYLSRAMQEAQGNKTLAASLVGLASYQTLKGWLTRYGVKE